MCGTKLLCCWLQVPDFDPAYCGADPAAAALPAAPLPNTSTTTRSADLAADAGTDETTTTTPDSSTTAPDGTPATETISAASTLPIGAIAIALVFLAALL